MKKVNRFAKSLKYIFNPISEKPNDIGFGYYDYDKNEWSNEEKGRKKFDNYYKKLNIIKWVIWSSILCLVGVLIS